MAFTFLKAKGYSLDGENWVESNKIEVSESGTYTVYVRDKLYNVSSKEITIDIVDNDQDYNQGDTPDNENWFATGKTRPSPIDKIKSFASEHNLSPVIYLGEQNIMDIETLVPQWESDGIIVITEPDDLVV